MIFAGLIFAGFAFILCYFTNIDNLITERVNLNDKEMDQFENEISGLKTYKASKVILYSAVPLSFCLGIWFENIAIRYTFGILIGLAYLLYVMFFLLATSTARTRIQTGMTKLR